MRTEIVICATRTKNILGEKGKRIKELTFVVQKRFRFPENSMELYAEKVNNTGLCAIVHDGSLRYKLLGGLAVRSKCSFQFESYFIGWKMSWRKIKRQPIVQTTTYSPTPSWDLLPTDILPAIFKNLWIGDRIRSRLVCRLWNQILTQQYIPKMPEAPWQILSNDSYRNPVSCLKEIRFKSLSDQCIYCFRPPLSISNNQGWWFCGSSRGWLLIAVGVNLNASMFLWQPLSGETRKLPPLSTLPYFDEYIALGVMGTIENLSSVIRRVEVFSMGSIECVVVVIFKRNTCDEIALCTPHEKTWKVFGGGNFKMCYSDLLFRSTNKQLCALATRMPPRDQWQNFVSNNKEILLTEGCRIPLSIILMPLEVTSISRGIFQSGLQLAQTKKRILYLVESSLTQKILLVSVWFDFVASKNAFDEPIVRFRCQRTTQLRVATLAPENHDILGIEIYKLEKLTGIGEETIFLGDAGSFSIPTIDSVWEDCMYFATDDAEGLEIHSDDAKKPCVLREHGVFSLQRKKMEHISFTPVRLLSGSRVGWFMPEL